MTGPVDLDLSPLVPEGILTMPSFDTPAPATLNLHLGFVVANVRIVAGDHDRTDVDIRPADATRKADVKVFEQTKVDFADGEVTVRAPKLTNMFGRSGGIDVDITLPAGSRLSGESGMGPLVVEGELGECRFKNGYGEMRVQRAGTVYLRSGSGDIVIDDCDGGEIVASNGSIRIRHLGGACTVKNSNGTTWIGHAEGDLRVNAANGGIVTERADAGVTAKTANGSIHVGRVAAGEVSLETSSGGLELGIAEGVAAWLDLHTTTGRVRSELEQAEAPAEPASTVQVRARTTVGDIVVRRA